MKKLFIAAAMCAAAVPVLAQTGVSINIGEPGFYGQINIGDVPRPQVYVAQPVIIERAVHYRDEPVYLRVPPGHRKNWRKHCHRYDACGQRVLFVRDEWYTNTYAPRVRHVEYRSDGRRADSYRDGYRDGRRDDRRHDERQDRDDDRGHGKGHGKGHGHGKDKD
ncbi:hypothetical protein [Massilia cavernae]|uniref:Uncharacterized protein n=1 Tax=Massilia cavernae TaxID=2320864 RepID=A0A418XR35_9BURK|nr:hypothetical protein [Massilia cavernae]RJG14939.1 hypothetical protein D3872_15395 [Massilia cavernae]